MIYFSNGNDLNVSQLFSYLKIAVLESFQVSSIARVQKGLIRSIVSTSLKNTIENNQLEKVHFIKVNELKVTQVELF